MNENLFCTCRLHPPVDNWDDWDHGEQKVVSDVREFGWHVEAIFDPNEELPWWCFTIGLFHNFGVPDLAMVGLGQDGMHYWLNEAGALIKAGLRPSDGDLIEDVLDGYELLVKDVAPGWAESLFGFARWFYRHPEPAMQQLVWPDPERRMPWDTQATENCRVGQARLWLPPSDHPPGPWTETAAS